eukprot:406497-Alexandrium_andersonii.AAC.1
MSASLVGSEMCIRDRNTDFARISAAVEFGEVWLLGVLHWPVPRHCPRPVSYTHLTLPTICSV